MKVLIGVFFFFLISAIVILVFGPWTVLWQGLSFASAVAAVLTGLIIALEKGASET